MNTRLMNQIMRTFDKGSASVVVSRKSADSDMNKGRGANRNPFYGRTDVEAIYSGFVMGTDYTNSVANTAQRMGEDVSREDVKLKETWHRPCDGEYGKWFSTDKRTATKCYLKLQRNEQQKGFKVEKHYFVDGRAATRQEIAAINKWLKKSEKKQSSTQIECGLDEEHEQHFILITLDHVLYIQQNNRTLRPYEHATAAAEYAAVAAL